MLCAKAAECPQGVFVDHLSVTLVNKKHPQLYPGASVVGLVLSPTVPIWCAFAGDAGSGLALTTVAGRTAGRRVAGKRAPSQLPAFPPFSG